MKKRDLIEQLARSQNLSLAQAGVVVDAFCDAVTHGVARDGRVTLRGFGSFRRVGYAARPGQNPRTGEAVDVPAKRVPRFKPARALCETVNGVLL